ncbi:hypothetical protein CONPUDRAFT_156874 [Coniophora puteana RWD-64-598 SS2]|uniref:Uncharacterized protein n=1 Tax=Coniophora puteana (strain RWD-64-598) TaxID=741705 RepID=A0A5M3MEN7_CONPW|nr:uncharacterized protein CONPUDRAFT_156874 [Coniophora puteana RWD-64-598 SS2]EIW77688.1 hypothetical protein CONPUDRAFT_156874 [Coniophora puteana RWD-64-598 SS2]
MFKDHRARSRHINAYHVHPRQPQPLSSPQNQPAAWPESSSLVGAFDDLLVHDDGIPSPTEPEDLSHLSPSPSPPKRNQRIIHPHLTGRPCNEYGEFLEDGTHAPPRNEDIDDWSPFADKHKVEMSAPNIDFLLELWAFDAAQKEVEGPFISHRDVYSTIDSVREGGVPWECLSVGFTGDVTPDSPSWKAQEYHIWYQNPNNVIQTMLSNRDFAGQFDAAPYQLFDQKGDRRWDNVMAGNYSWRQSSQIYEDDPTTDGAMYCPVILGSDKTTVSVATGHVEYHPLYLSIGNVHNADCKYDNDPEFRTFKRKLFHSSLSAVLQPLRGGMTVPVRVLFKAGVRAPSDDLDGDPNAGRRTKRWTDAVINAFSSMEVWDQLSIDDDVVPFTYDFPRADIHAMLAPDLLHQIIKGSFKDHLVTWVEDFLKSEHGEKRAGKIMDDIDRRIALTPSFPGLRCFPHGRRFKQWTGDNSKALMKVIIPALVEYVPAGIIRCLYAFMDFCYIVRRSELGQRDLIDIQDALKRFHTEREIFRDSGEFGPPNGLCSSITESRHITAVKRPWRRSSRFKALGQMLLTNQRLDKLAAARTDFIAPARASSNAEADDIEPKDVDGVMADVFLARHPQPKYPKALHQLSSYMAVPELPALVREFLEDKVSDYPSPPPIPPVLHASISIFHSATAIYRAPSDVSGAQGMRREIIRSTPVWRGDQNGRHDCVFIAEDEEKGGMFSRVGRIPDPLTGMWKTALAVGDKQRELALKQSPHAKALARARADMVHIKESQIGAYNQMNIDALAPPLHLVFPRLEAPVTAVVRDRRSERTSVIFISREEPRLTVPVAALKNRHVLTSCHVFDIDKLDDGGGSDPAPAPPKNLQVVGGSEGRL